MNHNDRPTQKGTESVDPVDALDFTPDTGRRAVYEAFSFERAGDIVRVWNDSHGPDADEHAYTVELDDRDLPTACTCPAYEYHCGPGEVCKHAVAVALHHSQIEDEAADGPVILADGGASLGPLPAVTEHREPVEQGGAMYHRCEGCGRETIYGADALPHAEGCPRREGR